MSDHKVSIKYNIDEIFACRDENCLMPRELEEYCNNRYKSQMIILAELVKPMDDVTKSHSHGVNPNDISLKNTIRDNLNKVSHSNYKIILEELKSLNYTCENHFAMLASELIVKSMNDVLACRGVEASKKDQKTGSEIYTSIAAEFTNYSIKEGNNTIRFKAVLVKECKSYFDKLTDKKERMDQNNPHRVSNYKGFMNMIGLMYANGLFPKDIVQVCSDKIINLIVKSGLPQDDCDNYYAGYERLMNRVLCHFEGTPIQPHMIQEFKSIKDMIQDLNLRISKVCEDDKKTKTASSQVKPLRTFSIMTHQQNIKRYKSLCDQYKVAEETLRQTTDAL